MIGTTPTHIFRLPFSTLLIDKVRIIYAQNDEQILVKETADCDLKGNQISVTLTQEETFKFDHSKCVQIQVRILTGEGQALKSRVKIISIEDCLDREVM